MLSITPNRNNRLLISDMGTYLHKLVCYKIEIGYLKQHCPPASSGMIWNGFVLSGGRFKLRFSEERTHLQSFPGQRGLGPSLSCHCLQNLTSLVMHTVPLKMSPPPWELVTAHHTWKTIRHRKFWDWPRLASPFCFVLSLDDFREEEGGVQWMLQPPPPPSLNCQYIFSDSLHR